MPMNIKCPECKGKGYIGEFGSFRSTIKCCKCHGDGTLEVYTDRELNHAKIKAYQDVLDACNKTESLDCIKDFIEEKIYSVKKKMEV